MECGDLSSQRVDVGRGQLAAGKRPACQGLLRELPHLHRVFDDRPSATEDGRFYAARDLDDVEIELGRQTTVEPQLFFAIEASSGEAAEVQKTQLERLFDLVCELPGQQDVRNVRLDQEGVPVPRTGNRIAQCRYESCLDSQACNRIGCRDCRQAKLFATVLNTRQHDGILTLIAVWHLTKINLASGNNAAAPPP